MSRHANSGRKLSRNTSHRKALLDNLVRAVILSSSPISVPSTSQAIRAGRVTGPTRRRSQPE